MSVNYEALAWAIMIILGLTACYTVLTREDLTENEASVGCLPLIGVPFLWLLCIIGVMTKEAECERGGNLFDDYPCQPWGWLWFVAPSVLSFVVFVYCVVRKWAKK